MKTNNSKYLIYSALIGAIPFLVFAFPKKIEMILMN